MGKKVFFHVVKSVKGGCGKSTYSFMLAQHLLQTYQKSRVYIIDLDICGTSWETDFGNTNPKIRYMSPKDNTLYINDVVKGYRNVDKQSPWRELDGSMAITGAASESKKIQICISDPKRNKELSTYEVDLFENAIRYLVDHTIEITQEEELHFIFDMPPSNERHAEQVLRGWLLDQELKGELHELKVEYKISIYLVSVYDVAHLQSNIDYLNDLFTTHSITDYQNELISLNKLDVIFVLNDVAGIEETLGNPEKSSEHIDDYINSHKVNLKDLKIGLVTLKRMDIPHKTSILREELSLDRKPIISDVAFPEIIKTPGYFSISNSSK